MAHANLTSFHIPRPGNFATSAMEKLDWEKTRMTACGRRWYSLFPDYRKQTEGDERKHRAKENRISAMGTKHCDENRRGEYFGEARKFGKQTIREYIRSCFEVVELSQASKRPPSKRLFIHPEAHGDFLSNGDSPTTCFVRY